VTAYLVTAGGAKTDPVNRPGVSNLTAELMTKGTVTGSVTQIAGHRSVYGAIGSDAGATAPRSR
jgi:zinc protease